VDYNDRKQNMVSPRIIPPHGGYRDLKSNQICIIHRINYLLDEQLHALGKEFLGQGGFTENLYRARTQRCEWKRQP